MNDNDDFEARANAIFERIALHFGRQAEMLEATNARMSNNVKTIEKIKRTNTEMKETLDRIEGKC